MALTIDQAHLPRLLAELTPAVGTIKADYEDFVVDEVPLYPADGTGTHVYFLLEKTGLSTVNAVNDLARALGVPRREIGYAGLKDARAITRQWLSIEHIEPQKLRELGIPRLRIREITRHRNKIRLGHLKGNRFVIKVRQTETERLAELQDGLAQLARVGVPNYFGQQRFGGRGDTWEIGRAIVNRQIDDAVDLILGRPGPHDHGEVRRARQLYERGDYDAAARTWPGMFRTERVMLKTLARTRGKKLRALLAIDQQTRVFYVSAYQSHLFNQIVAARMAGGLDRVIEGDLAWLHASGAVFLVQDVQREQARAEAFEISPTGPLYGRRMTRPGGAADELEQRILGEANQPLQSFLQSAERVQGGRRPLRFQPTDAQLRLGADARGAYLELSFFLPRGCYATALLRELFGSGTAPAESEAAGESVDAGTDD